MILVAVAVLAALLARRVPRWDPLLAWVVGAVLAASAGLSTLGGDYDEYVGIIENTRTLANQDIALQLLAAKDPLFLLIINLAGALSDDVQLVFVIVAILAVTAKVIATSAIPGKRTQFMAIYAVLIAPSLEYTAIRAGLALGMMMLAYMVARRGRWRVMWVLLGLTSHLSVLFILLGRLWPRWWRPIVFCMIILGPVVLPAFVGFVSDDGRYSHYLDNPGTLFAFAMPGMTMLSLLMLSRSLKGRLPSQGIVLSRDGLTTTYVVAATALMLTLPIVTAAIRVMELAWVLLLPQLLVRDQLIHRRIQAYQAASWCMMIGVLLLSNILRGTWKVLV
jgi:hypothetical protein